MNTYDVVVIGGGQTGRQIAHELANLDKKVAIVTLNDDSASLFERTVKSLAFDRPQEETDFHGPAHVDTFRGQPVFQSSEKVLTVGPEQLAAKKFVVATGSIPRIPPIQGLDQTPFSSPLDIYSKPDIPKSALIIGAGPLGVSLAQHLANRQCQVTLLSAQPQILSHEEPELVEAFTGILGSQGIKILHQTEVVQTRELPGGKVSVVCQSNGEQSEIDTDSLVLASGFVHQSRGFGLENHRVYIDEKDRLVTNDQMETACPYIYAAGSVTGPLHLAAEEHQAQLVINNITKPFFMQEHFEPESFPFTIPTNPAFARVGLTEEEARKKYKDTVVQTHFSRKPEAPHACCVIKLIGRQRFAEILGAHILSPHAEEMILFFDLALRAEVRFSDLLERHHYPKPTEADGIYLAIKKWMEQIS